MSFKNLRHTSRTRRVSALLAVVLSVGGASVAVASTAEAAPMTQYTTTAYPDNLDGWIAQAQAILAQDGDQVPSADAITARAMTESSGNPLAENHWDSNQALYGGTYGLLQLIQPTFDEYALPGHQDIMNPVDSIIAGVRYANATYGSFESIAYSSGGY
ncbi:transglycosylase SLT domain-containing protein [Streptacidiphilus rugosus]|uniref:transglycosylase SLT domain-containing protein n=1 Tax=Streptacidiphilus rugosus TaxID=405783 RepID=UPI0005658489|nr:transglycosylase SLT domain-containing protein [Streptacidiphilus rugosus]